MIIYRSIHFGNILGNETEARAFSESFGLGTQDIKEIAVKMAAMPKKNEARPRLVVITQGADPTIAVQNGKISEFPVIPIKTEDIVDSNGAGDAFCGGFFAGYVQGAFVVWGKRSGMSVYRMKS